MIVIDKLDKINANLDLVNRINEIDKEKLKHISIIPSIIVLIILILILVGCIFMFYKIITKKNE